MKKISLFFAILIVTSVSFLLKAQNPEIDSLLHELSMLKEDTNKVILLNEIASKYKKKDIEKKKHYAEQALILSKQIAYKRGTMHALNNLGDYEYRLNITRDHMRTVSMFELKKTLLMQRYKHM